MTPLMVADVCFIVHAHFYHICCEQNYISNHGVLKKVNEILRVENAFCWANIEEIFEMYRS